MPDWVAAAWARLRALDGRIADATSKDSAFDRRMTRATGRVRNRAAGATGALAARTPEGVRQAATKLRAADPLGRDPTGLAAAVIVYVVALVITWLLWAPLSWPASLVNALVSAATPTSCAFLGPSNIVSDNACGTVLAILTILGAITATAGLILIRLPLRRTLAALFDGIPTGLAFLGAPLLATVLFIVGWAGVQYHFPERPGIVTDGTFPAVVGLLTYALATYGPSVQRQSSTWMDWRDRLEARQRVGAVLLTPVVFSLVATPLLHTPVRDQSTVIVAMVAGYLLLAPRVSELETRTTAGARP